MQCKRISGIFKKIIKYGVCAFFPTLATDTVNNLKRQIEEIKSAIKLQESEAEPMAKILGIHLEACFINPAKKESMMKIS